MSTLIEDIEKLTSKFEFRSEPLTEDKLKFRFSLLAEELIEFRDAIDLKSAEDAVDALIDLTVVALGTLAIANVDIQKAWDEVHRANISKERGIKPGREASGGFDLIKPAGWTGPVHTGNHGRFEAVFTDGASPGC